MRQRAILDAAKSLFYLRGFDGVGVDEIGEAAGISGPAIYRHFDGKDDILAALFDEAMDRLLLIVEPPTNDPAADLMKLIRGQAEFALSDRELLSIYAREDRALSGATRRRLHRRQRQHVDRWVDSLRRCYPTRSEEHLLAAAHAIIGMLISPAHWPAGVLRTERLEELMVDLAEHSLAGLVEAR